MRDGETRVAYVSVASAIARCRDAAASQVAEQLDTEVLALLRKVTGVESAASWPSKVTSIVGHSMRSSDECGHGRRGRRDISGVSWRQ
jgi:hypothetical protein